MKTYSKLHFTIIGVCILTANLSALNPVKKSMIISCKRVLDGTVKNMTCPTDINGDGVTTDADISLLLKSLGKPCKCTEDINGDGIVSGADLNLLLLNFNNRCKCTMTQAPSQAGHATE